MEVRCRGSGEEAESRARGAGIIRPSPSRRMLREFRRGVKVGGDNAAPDCFRLRLAISADF